MAIVEGAGHSVSVTGTPRAYLAGLSTSVGTDTDHDIDFAIGISRDNADSLDLEFSGILVKQIDVNWASGTNAGGFPSGLTLTADTWYHLFVVNETDASIDAGFDTSLTATNLLSDTGGSEFRRIGSVLTDSSSNIIAYTQIGPKFLWDNPPEDVNTTAQGTTAVNYTLSVPLGISVFANMNIVAFESADEVFIYLSNPDVDDEAPDPNGAPLATIKNDVNRQLTLQADIDTNTSSQIRARANQTADRFRVVTLGWVDRRGRDD